MSSGTPKGATGRGLGLAVSRALAEAMGARLVLDDDGSRGAVFKLYLRRAQAAASPVRSSTSMRPPALPAGTRVLVLDDDAAIRELLEVALSLRGASVIATASPEVARGHLHRGEVDVVLVDDRLEGSVSGTAWLRDVAGRYPAVGKVLMTGAPTLDHLDPAMRRSTVRKPFVLDDVVAALTASRA